MRVRVPPPVLALVPAVVLAALCWGISDWAVMTDELLYERLAISVAHTGSPLDRLLQQTQRAARVGATSDNLATNVLLRVIGLEAVRARAESLGLRRTALLDLVRNRRGPDDAPQLSVGSMAELAWLFGALSRGEVVDPVTSQRVLGWLSLNSDLSMVASAFGLDPLAHREEDHGIQMVNKTGTDAGVRSEAGVVRSSRAGVAYAVTVQFADTDLLARLRVLDAMRTVGRDILEYIH